MKDRRGCIIGLGIVLLLAFGPMILAAILTDFWSEP